MIYIDKDTINVVFPKTSSLNVNSIKFTNQTTKESFYADVTDISTNKNSYVFDISQYTKYFQNGQYDYVLRNSDVFISSGILQFGDYKDNKGSYTADVEIVQYDAASPYTPLPDRTLKITENGTYNVDDYNKADVNVQSGATVSSFGIATINTKSIGLLPGENGRFTQYTNHIYLTFVGDIWANKDLYVGLSRYKKHNKNLNGNKITPSNRFVLFRDFRKKLDTPLECYKSENNVYAYTDGNKWYMHRDPSDFTTWCDVAYNRAYCVNELIDFVGNAQEDYNMQRYADGDLYDYVNVNSNATTVDEIIKASLGNRGGIMCYLSYMQNTPIVPIKISDLYIIADGVDTGETLNSITKEQFDGYKSVQFEYTYTTEWIMNRFAGDIGRLVFGISDASEYFNYICYDNDKLPNFVALKKRIENPNFIGEHTRGKYSKMLNFNIYTEEQIRKGQPSNVIGINKKIFFSFPDNSSIVSLI